MTHIFFLVLLVALIGIPGVLIATRLLGFRRSTVVAVLQDATPLVLVLSWIAAVVAVIFGYYWIAGFGLCLGLYHVVVLHRSVSADEVPPWVEGAASIRLAVANIFIDNAELDASVHQLIEIEADVLVVVETTCAFRRAFDAGGGLERFPHRTFNPDDESDYAVSMYTSVEPKSIAMISLGRLPAATAVIDVGGADLRVVGVIPHAAVDPDSFRKWRRELRAIGRYARHCHQPLVVAGDLNTTVHRVAFDDLRDAGLRDAHEELGKGIKPSFSLGATGLLALVGPLVRLDHAMLNRWVWPLEVQDLDAAGSDHEPFVITLAVQSPPRRVSASRSPSSPT